MVALVSGGCGFIGSHLVDQLIDLGHKVVVVDNLSTGKIQNLNENALFYNIDIRNHDFLKELFETQKFDVVFHLAAMAKIPWCTEHPLESHEINVTATLHLLELSRMYGIKAFVYSSSSSVYGEVKTEEPIKETQPIAPISLYGLQKFASEHLCTLYGMFGFVPTVSLRYFNVYGTNRQSPDGPYANVMSAFIRDYKKNGRVTIFGDGKQKRDFVHVLDVARANIQAAEAVMRQDIGWGNVYNVGTGQVQSIQGIAEILGYSFGYGPARQEDPRYSCADMRKTEGDGILKVHMDLEKGIKILLQSYEKR